jgi:endonuclease/exonuclease/phosphatase family metal-dependent hydrolase
MNFFGKLILFFNWIFILLLFGTYLSGYISPFDNIYLAFLGLVYPIIFFVNLCFVFYWLIVFNKRFLYSLIAILIGYSSMKNHFQFNAIKEEPKNNALNVVDFNSKAFGAYEEKKYDENVFFDKLDELKPDIMCFQEFLSNRTEIDIRMFNKLEKKYKKFYSFNKVNTDNLHNISICIYSRYPIIRSGFVEKLNKSANCTIFSDILYNSDTITIINTHLKSIAFEPIDFETIKEIKERKENYKINPSSITRIVAKLRKAFLVRAKQAEMIEEFIKKNKHKIILTGDFNDSPSSYAYKTIKGNMKDAFVESGSGASTTYIGKMPSFRIDYILADKSFEIVNYKPHLLNFSDHKMISATIKF